MTEKSLADYSPSEKAQWRAYEDDPIKFLESLSWSPQDKNLFQNSFPRAFKQRGVRFKDYLISAAMTEVKNVKDLIEEPEREQVVRWSSLPLSRKVQMTDASCDDLICCWLEIKEIDYEILSDHEEKYINLLCRLLPIEKAPDIVVSAFHRDEKQTWEGRLPSFELYQKNFGILQSVWAQLYGAVHVGGWPLRDWQELLSCTDSLPTWGLCGLLQSFWRRIVTLP